MAVTLIVAGCSSATESDSETTASANRTHSVDTVFGSVDIPVAPQRIVAIDNAAEVAAHYGVVPVGINGGIRTYMDPADYAVISDATVIEPSWHEYDFESIAALRPDLIVGTVWDDADRKDYKLLSAIAPTALFSLQGEDELPTQEATLQVAEALGKGDEAEADKQEYLKTVADMRETYADELKSIVWASVYGADQAGQFYAAPNDAFSGELLGKLGARFSQGAQPTGDATAVEYSFENVDAVADATIVTYDVRPQDAKPDGPTAALLDYAGFQQLPAVAAGMLFPLRYTQGQQYGILIQGLHEIEKILKSSSS